MHAHGSSPDPKSRRDHGASIKSAHAVRGAVTPDPVNARALAPVGTDGSGAATWSGYKIIYYSQLQNSLSLYIYIYIYI